MTDTENTEPITNAEVVTVVEAVGENLGGVATEVRRGRNLSRVLAASVVFDIALSVGLFVAVQRTDDAQVTLEKVVAELATVAEARAVACDLSNTQAVKQHQLWEGLLALPQPEGDPTVLEMFNRLLDETFPQQDCNR